MDNVENEHQHREFRVFMVVRSESYAEHAADGVVHAAGIAASLAGFAALLAVSFPHVTPGMAIALAVYALTVVALFCASAANNMILHTAWQPLLQRFDHAAIYLKIAGTYTPLVVMMGSFFTYGILAIVWAGAVAGAALRLMFGDRFARFSIGLYLLLGWASVAMVWPMFERLPTGAAVLVLVGGLLYTVGVIFHTWEQLRFQRAIWHSFVLAASSCHFAAVAWSSLQLAA